MYWQSILEITVVWNGSNRFENSDNNLKNLQLNSTKGEDGDMMKEACKTKEAQDQGREPHCNELMLQQRVTRAKWETLWSSAFSHVKQE